MRALTPKLVNVKVVQLDETHRMVTLKVTLLQFWRQQDRVMRFNLHHRGTPHGGKSGKWKCEKIEKMKKGKGGKVEK